MSDIIDDLLAMDDNALMGKLGLNAQLKEARSGLTEMAALSGDARKEAASRVDRMFQPHVYPSEMKWIAKDAQRAAKCKDAAAEMCDCSPSSLMDD